MACRLRRLLAEGRRSELLDLPPQFDADLAAWLADEAAPDAAQRLQIRCGAGQPEWGGQAAPCRLAPEGCDWSGLECVGRPSQGWGPKQRSCQLQHPLNSLPPENSLSAAAAGLAPTPPPHARAARWLHDLRVGDYANAAVSIAELAGASGERAPQLAAGEARRLLALDRLAAWAASPAWPSAVAGEVAGVAEAADAQLGLLALQVGSAQGMLAS